MNGNVAFLCRSPSIFQTLGRRDEVLALSCVSAPSIRQKIMSPTITTRFLRFSDGRLRGFVRQALFAGTLHRRSIRCTKAPRPSPPVPRREPSEKADGFHARDPVRRFHNRAVLAREAVETPTEIFASGFGGLSGEPGNDCKVADGIVRGQRGVAAATHEQRPAERQPGLDRIERSRSPPRSANNRPRRKPPAWRRFNIFNAGASSLHVFDHNEAISR